MTSKPRLLPVLSLLGTLLVLGACANPNLTHRAAERAADELLENFDAYRVSFGIPAGTGAGPMGVGPQQVSASSPGIVGQVDPVQEDTVRQIARPHVILILPDEFYSVVNDCIADDFVIAPRGELQDKVVLAMQNQRSDVNLENQPVPGLLGPEVLELGLHAQANLLIMGHLEDVDETHKRVSLFAFQLTQGVQVARGTGSSYEGPEIATSSFFWITSPLVALYDIFSHSIDYAFDNDANEDSSFFGTIGDGVVAIVYLPFAPFTCDYPATKSWVN
jgi:hypothetical protein